MFACFDPGTVPFRFFPGDSRKEFIRFFRSIFPHFDHPGIPALFQKFESEFTAGDNGGKSFFRSIPFPGIFLHIFFCGREKVKVGAVKSTANVRLAITALGLYQAEINGQKVSPDLFTPGWTDYYQRVQYQVCDVSPLLREGENEIAVFLGEGWYCGRIARHWGEDKPTWGKHPMLLAEVRQGSETLLITDENWKSYNTCYRYSDIYDGEKYDGTRLSPTGDIIEECEQRPAPRVFPAPDIRIEWHSGAFISI